MPTLRELLQRRTALAVEMRQINDAAGDAALSGDAEVRWTALRGEMDTLQAAIDRQAILDDLDRRASGQQLGAGNPDQRFQAELRNFSVVRALAGAANLPGVDAGREREISAEVAR